MHWQGNFAMPTLLNGQELKSLPLFAIIYYYYHLTSKLNFDKPGYYIEGVDRYKVSPKILVSTYK